MAARLVLVLGLVLAAQSAAADDDAAGSAISGTLRAGYWTSSRALDNLDNLGTLTLWTRAAPHLSSTTSLVFDGWFGYPDVSSGDHTTGSVREAYADLVLGSFEARIGKRIIVWGRADAVNPTDNLTPRDYTLLVSDDADQRFGAYSAELAWHHDALTVTGIWLPGFQPTVVPLPSTFAFSEQAPRWVDSEQQAAFKLEQTGGRLDWSVSYFDGYDRTPDLAGSAQLVLEHHRTHVIGADAAAVFGRYQVRSEMAFTITDDWNGKRLDIPSPFLFGVVGADRTFGNYLNVNAQYLLRVVVHHRDPFAVEPAEDQMLAIENAVIRNELDAVQHGATVRISDQWWNETLGAELLGALLVPHASYAVRGKVTYAISDRWKGIVGVDYYNGRDPSFFRNLHDTSTVFVEVRLGL